MREINRMKLYLFVCNIPNISELISNKKDKRR